ncbi:MAG TPA: hypothetical protein VNB90_12245 [Cytophagaceae bacterium]|nr:hypothetical protein [Cytophagaceae bacterium]
MKKVITLLVFSAILLSGSFTEGFSAPPKKKTSLEKRMKKQNKKKKRKGDTTCPKIDC